MDPLDDSVPVSQLAADAFTSNPVNRAEGPTSFGAAFQRRRLLANGAAPGLDAPIVLTPDNALPKHGKLINDPVHGSFRLGRACTALIDTRQFQRLRRLKQLGVTYYVFPGASHNRFEHSLGVAHLSYRWATQLHLAQPELECDPGDIRVVELAGLCHDLGHGPYSHVFEREFLRRRGITEWEHEAMSADMLDFIIDDNHLEAVSPDDVKRVKALITAAHEGAPSSQSLGLAPWLTDIVANGRNSIDVDKFDYLARDALYCGVKTGLDFNRIMQFSRVIEGEVCFKYTEYMCLHELFHARASMHRSVYTHKKAKAIEFMIVDALLEADRALKISDKIWDPADFVRLDDGLLELVENWDVLGGLVRAEEEDEAAIKAAQAIITRLRRRQLYKYVTDVLVPTEALERGHWQAPTAEDVVACQRSDGTVRLRPEDVILQENKIDYAMRERNPLDSVSFFDGLDSVQKRKLRPDQVPSMVVATFQEKCLRCYSRNSDPRYVAALHEAFAAWVARRFGGSVETSTPAKPPRTQWVQGEEQAGGKRGRALDYALPPAHANGERTAQRRRDL